MKSDLQSWAAAIGAPLKAGANYGFCISGIETAQANVAGAAKRERHQLAAGANRVRPTPLMMADYAIYGAPDRFSGEST